MNRSESIKEIVSALSKAQSEIRPAEKDGQNPHLKSRYSTLQSVWDACREPLAKNGLAIIQTTESKEDRLVLITTLAHVSGEWFSSEIPVITQKMDPQGIGSALTYYKRYSITAIVGVVSDEDDDAEGTKSNHPPQTIQVAKRGTDKISEKQVNLLHVKIGKDEVLKEKIMSHLKTLNINSFEEIPKEMMEKILNRIELSNQQKT